MLRQRSESGPQNPEFRVWEIKLKWKKIGVKVRVGGRKMPPQVFGTVATKYLSSVGAQCAGQTHLRGKHYIICQINERVSICKAASWLKSRQDI